VNLHGSHNVVTRALEAGVKRFVLASSCSVYGRGMEAGLTESSELHPVSLYAKCKAEVEKVVLGQASGKGMCTTVLRFATVFGLSPRMRFDLAINVMTKNAYTLGKITVDGGGVSGAVRACARRSEVILHVLTDDASRVDGQIL